MTERWKKQTEAGYLEKGRGGGGHKLKLSTNQNTVALPRIYSNSFIAKALWHWYTNYQWVTAIKQLLKNAINCIPEFSISSNVQGFHSRNKAHIKHNGTGTMFQISEECLPTQFHQPNKRSITLAESTQ